MLIDIQTIDSSCNEFMDMSQVLKFGDTYHSSETCIKRPRLGQKKRLLGGLLLEVKMHDKPQWDMPKWSLNGGACHMTTLKHST